MRSKTNWLIAGTAAGAIGAMLIASGGGAQTAAVPKARYYMDVSTATGPLAGGLKSLLRGGGESRSLMLRLGSTLAPTGGPAQADHFLPAGATLGASVPLTTPTPAEPVPPTASTGGTSEPGQYQRPKGRLLIYWGCGAHPGSGQPAIIDFAKLSEGQIPPNLFSTSVPVDRPPSEATSHTYGFWPGPKAKHPQPTASIVGDHRVAGNYTPTIGFALTQDFLPALNASVAAQPDGSGTLSWNAVAGATGYYAWAFTAGQNGDTIWWTSASKRELGAGLWDYVAPAVVARLVPQGIVMPASQTSCQIPAEVRNGGTPVTFVNAFGPEADFAYPPRPANSRAAWRPEWTVKVRYKSSAMVLPGLGGNGGAQGDDKRKLCKPKLGHLLGLPAGGASDCK